MCVIAGGVNLTIDEELGEKMLATMARRGPDGHGAYREPGLTLMQGRLAIVDLSGGIQPMSARMGEETYTLVYNGEIYNAPELRRELAALGHCFTTRSDTEVVLHSYIQWREKCTQRLNGVFAFSVWESRSKRLFLARDRIGVKPLFYTQAAGGLLFASEMKTLLCCPEVRPVLDAQGSAQLILLGPGRIPGSGIFRDIRELEPGCSGVYADGVLNISRYWKLRDRVHTESFPETAEHVRYLLEDAVRRQRQADVPMGALLSGGLDSSILCAMCAREGNLQTFSVDYENNDRYFVPGKFQPNADAPYIADMVLATGANHHRRVIRARELADCLEEAVEARDLPGMGDIDASLLLLCKFVAGKAKMVLSGECADEIFGGYPWYRDPEVRSQSGFPWAQNTALRAGLLSRELGYRLNPEEFVGDLYSQTLAQSDILPETDPENRRIKELVNLNFRWFMQTLLDRTDRMSMAAGVEVRVPYCDYRIAEYLYGVPWEYKDIHGREKGLLREAMGNLLPESVRNRKKSPYPKTFDPAYTAIVKERLEGTLSKPDCPVYALMDREKLKALLASDEPWPWYGQLMRRPQIMAYVLQLEYWLRRYQVIPEL